MTEQGKDWLSKLKAGDELAVSTFGFDRTPQRAWVTRMTKQHGGTAYVTTYARPTYERRFDTKFGRERGQGYPCSYILELTPQVIDQMLRRELLNFLEALFTGRNEEVERISTACLEGVVIALKGVRRRGGSDEPKTP